MKTRLRLPSPTSRTVQASGLPPSLWRAAGTSTKNVWSVPSASARYLPAMGLVGCRLGAQALGVNIDDEGGEQDHAADQDLEEAIDIDVIEAVVEDAEDEQ